MNEEKIREKYPNIRNEEEFEKLCIMLKYKNKAKIASICGLILLCVLPLLGVGSMACILAGLALLYTGKVWLNKHVDELFLATASRSAIENHIILSLETIQKEHRKYSTEQLVSDLFASAFVGITCMGVCFVIWSFSGKGDFNFLMPVFLIGIPLVFFGFVRIKTIIHKRNGEDAVHILQATLSERDSHMSTEPENTADEYFFIFDCGDYGKLKYRVGKTNYRLAFVGRDEYYLLVVKSRFFESYKIITIYSTEEYIIAPELAGYVAVIS